MCHKKQAITWATKCGTVSHHSMSIPESAFLWGRRFSTLPLLGWTGFLTLKTMVNFFKWCDGNVFLAGNHFNGLPMVFGSGNQRFDCCPKPGKQCDGHMVASWATIGFDGFPMVFRSEATIGFDCFLWLSTVGQTMRCSLTVAQVYLKWIK